MNKHKILQEWVKPFLTDGRFLNFESFEMYPNARSIVPQYGDYVKSEDVLGNKSKSYTFAFVGIETTDTGTSDVNSDNMKLFDDFNLWIEEQQKNKNFPNFGDNTSEYKLIPLQNMANVAFVDESGNAKYMLSVRIDYLEESED